MKSSAVVNKELLLFNRLFDEYRTALVSFARSYLKDSDLAEDIVQDVFVKIWSRISEINDSSETKNLVFTVTKNACISYLRQQANSIKYQNAVLAKIELLALENSTIEQIELKELQSRIDSTLKSLPLDYQEIFLLNRDEGLRYTDIAQQKSISVKTVEKKISLTLKKLRNSLSCLFWF
ncbi:RNA polymerase sigma-70 factor [Sphingobacterium yanglingense]|uniref:RNA polymerase sigma-70 factor (ECF subfamily) n=1 Tax=Sphingobacterium yanglingense TaxID=1437280 RepID=A0A4R6WDW4_9SPHI|nr:RNA polymerase sigma-70 factor [Sphingobacterium yanglingense]TDQ77923.1 RNA polymerase sigma-70 factor (ECF subfamily) [Sphingobacterium yanglingense]